MRQDGSSLTRSAGPRPTGSTTGEGMSRCGVARRDLSGSGPSRGHPGESPLYKAKVPRLPKPKVAGSRPVVRFSEAPANAGFLWQVWAPCSPAHASSAHQFPVGRLAQPQAIEHFLWCMFRSAAGALAFVARRQRWRLSHLYRRSADQGRGRDGGADAQDDAAAVRIVVGGVERGGRARGDHGRAVTCASRRSCGFHTSVRAVATAPGSACSQRLSAALGSATCSAIQIL